MEIKELSELIALSKLLQFVKFENSDDELSFFAGSSILSEIFKKVCEEIRNHFKEIPKEFQNEKGEFEWGYIENKSGYLEIIKERIKKIPNWNIINISIKTKLIEVYIHPYKFTNLTMNELCNN